MSYPNSECCSSVMMPTGATYTAMATSSLSTPPKSSGGSDKSLIIGIGIIFLQLLLTIEMKITSFRNNCRNYFCDNNPIANYNNYC